MDVSTVNLSAYSLRRHNGVIMLENPGVSAIHACNSRFNHGNPSAQTLPRNTPLLQLVRTVH